MNVSSPTQLQTTHQSLQCPCAIETLSVPNLTFACGSYELDEAGSGNRYGEIVVYSFISDTNLLVESFRHSFDAGLLDMKTITELSILIALSNGSLALVGLEASTDSSKSTVFSEAKLEEGLFLSVDLYSRPSTVESSTSYHVATSTQEGSLLLFNLSNERFQQTRAVNEAHKLPAGRVPAWIVAMNKHDSNMLLSGGDDYKLKLWDTRDFVRPTSVGNFHTAGVTSAQFHPELDNLVVVGSYDEQVSFWDPRNMKLPILSFTTGGGVWRSKWLNTPGSKYSYFATADMQNGCHVHQLDLTTMTKRSDMIYTDNLERHLSYGLGMLDSNVSFRTNNEEVQNVSMTLASCSFYDKKVDVWKATMQDK